MNINTYQNNNNHHHRPRPRQRQSILDMLFSILYTTPQSQLDDRRAGYLEKILSVLFRTRPKAMESYLNGDHLLLLEAEAELVSQILKSSSKNDVSTAATATTSTTTATANGDNKEHDDVDDETTATAITAATTEVLEQTESSILHIGGGIPLLDALFNHLHSNSVTQIVQRLLMPKPPSNKSSNDTTNNNNHNGEWNDSSSSPTGNEEEEDEYDENLITSGMEDFDKIDCNWADGEYALNLLLERLLGESDDLDDLLGDGNDSCDNVHCTVNDIVQP